MPAIDFCCLSGNLLLDIFWYRKTGKRSLPMSKQRKVKARKLCGITIWCDGDGGTLSFSGVYSIKLLDGVSYGGVPVHPGVRIEGDAIKIEFGGVRVLRDRIVFTVGDGACRSFRFGKGEVSSVKGGCGTILWENSATQALLVG